MTDINQWRRMIQPSRARTPAWDGDESEAFLSPTTPRKAALKPKLSSYFTQHTGSAEPYTADLAYGGELLFSLEPPTWLPPAPLPDADNLIDSVMCRLLAEPTKSLDSSFNGVLLQIFECFRSLGDDKQRLQSQLEQQVEKAKALELAMRQSAEDWEQERQQYKSEVKRLEIILAKGERGLAEVTLARQESVLRRGKPDGGSSDRTLETIFELLERSRRYEEKLFNHQRASMRKRLASPSLAMRRLSKHLGKDSAVRTAYGSIPVRTPRDVSGSAKRHVVGSTQIEESPVEHSKDYSSFDVPVGKTFCSDASFSTFSCDGDLLPDEDADAALVKAAETENVLASREQVDPNAIIPQLFNSRHNQSSALVDARDISRSSTKLSLSKHPTLKAKASGFFSKWRAPLRIDTSSASVRRFSFEPGDDADASLSAPMDGLTSSVKDRLLRKSASTSILFDISNADPTPIEPALSPIRHSPTATASQSDGKRLSRIPTPTYSAASLARPRAERDSSASSLLTAIKCSDRESLRSISHSSSVCSSPTTNQVHLTKFAQGLEGTTRGSLTTEEATTSSNPLVEQTDALRGNAFAVAAAKAAGTATAKAATSLLQPTTRPRISSRSSKRSSQSRTFQDARMRPENSESQIENGRPMTWKE